MRKIQLDVSGLRVESFVVRARGGLACVEVDAPMGEFYNTGNDHCTGYTFVVVTCASCGEEYDTCAYTCQDTCADTCADSCDVCGWTGTKPICPD